MSDEQSTAPVDPFLRRCPRCRKNLPLKSFSPDRAGREGLSLHCRDCLDPARIRARAAAERRSRLKLKFGITVEEYDQLLVRQGGVCAICRTARPGKGRQHFAVDHCHTTGKVRGLLCVRCNVALGALGDALEGLQRFVDYLAGPMIPDSLRGRQGYPRQLLITHYLSPEGKRVSKGTPGAVAVQRKTKTFYVQVQGRRISLKTTDEAEAYRRFAVMRQRRPVS